MYLLRSAIRAIKMFRCFYMSNLLDGEKSGDKIQQVFYFELAYMFQGPTAPIIIANN